MAKSEERLKARKLRKKGKSIGEIAQQVDAAKSTISKWCRDVELTGKQRGKLLERAKSKSARGRLKGAQLQKKRRLHEIEHLRKKGIRDVEKLNKREFFLAGIALYWAEGFKANDRCGFVNSDPEMVRFLISWMKEFLNLKNGDFYVNVDINVAHKDRIEEVERYWSRVTKIPLPQFRKPSFKYYNLRKKYENFENHYGTFRVYAKEGTQKVRRVLGWIEGLKANNPNNKQGRVA